MRQRLSLRWTPGTRSPGARRATPGLANQLTRAPAHLAADVDVLARRALVKTQVVPHTAFAAAGIAIGRGPHRSRFAAGQEYVAREAQCRANANEALARTPARSGQSVSDCKLHWCGEAPLLTLSPETLPPQEQRRAQRYNRPVLRNVLRWKRTTSLWPS